LWCDAEEERKRITKTGKLLVGLWKPDRLVRYAVVRMWNQKSISIGETGYLQVYSQTNTTTSDVPRDYFDFEKKFKPPGDTEGEIFLDGVT
jgi:hypothetical protein